MKGNYTWPRFPFYPHLSAKEPAVIMNEPKGTEAVKRDIVERALNIPTCCRDERQVAGHRLELVAFNYLRPLKLRAHLSQASLRKDWATSALPLKTRASLLYLPPTCKSEMPP